MKTTFLLILIILFSAIILLQFQADRLSTDPGLDKKIASFSKTATARNELLSETPLTLTPDSSVLTAPTNRAEFEPAIKAELPFYLEEFSHGSLAWVLSGRTLSVTQDRLAVYQQEFNTVVLNDFIVAADIQWNTTSPSSGCGFTIRTNGESRNLNRYIVLLTRISFGHIRFTALAEGIPVNLRDIYFNRREPDFSWENDSINRLAIVAKGNTLNLFVNHAHIGEIDVTEPPILTQNLPPPPAPLLETASESDLEAYNLLEKVYQNTISQIKEQYGMVAVNYQRFNSVFPRGFVGLAAINHNGQTTCNFSNAWLWSLDSSSLP